MKIPKRKLFLLIIFAYVAFSLYAAYNVFFSTKVISRVHRVVKKETGALSGNFTVTANVSITVIRSRLQIVSKINYSLNAVFFHGNLR